MVIVQLTGGLGNQLFQYAMGRTLATLRNTELKLDISFFETYEWHEYSLAPFNIIATIATKAEVEQLQNKKYGYIQRIKQKLFNALPITVIEDNLLYNTKYLNAGKNTYYQGYWQCEDYFKHLRTTLLKEFSVKIPPSKYNTELLQSIDNTANAVSLHIRRGNYVNVDGVNKVHGTTTLNYYEQAVQLIVSKCESPVFYVFSDDIAWAKENIKLHVNQVFVDGNDDKTDYEDLRLMAACKHNILANSTFSWWAAWLNVNPNKIIIAPQQWFADAEKNKEAIHIIPSNWIKL
ncbi:MAG: alpha-1,2-fucosyltransferase [Bacteroidia bacterium]